MEVQQPNISAKLPRVAITYCTQCKWMLRAAWMAQELLSTFGTSIGEIALITATGGIFTVHLTYFPKLEPGQDTAEVTEALIWDRKRDSGFPEAKILKQLIRNHIDPDKNLGHSDTPSSKNKATAADDQNGPKQQQSASLDREAPCDDCK